MSFLTSRQAGGLIMYRAILSSILVIGLASGWPAGVVAQTPGSIRLTNGEWPPFLSERAPH